MKLPYRLGIAAGLVSSLFLLGPSRSSIIVDEYGSDIVLPVKESLEAYQHNSRYPFIIGPVETRHFSGIEIQTFLLETPGKPYGFWCLDRMARRLGYETERPITGDQLAKSNDVKNPDLIHPGQVFRFSVGIVAKNTTRMPDASDDIVNTQSGGCDGGGSCHQNGN